MLRFLPALLILTAASAEVIQLHGDGGWCWFEDERAIVVDGKLLFGVVASSGNIEAVTYDMATKRSTVNVLHTPVDERDRLEWFDDHNSPAFLRLPGGRVLTMYAKHGPEEKIYSRVSKPGDTTAWESETFVVPSAKSRVTYSNLHRLSAENGGKGRIYDFFRGLNNSFKPSYIYSDDGAATWKTGGVFIDVPTEFRHRPYVKYASDGRTTIHIAYTDGHPRNFDNSIYHIYYRDGVLHRSDGTPIRSLEEGLRSPEEGTVVFKGDKNNVAWITDLHVDVSGRPYLVYSVQTGDGGKPQDDHGRDMRYRYARWDGKRWVDHGIARAGSRLYKGEDDYTGLAALDPHDPSVLYISTNADPATGKPLVSKADGQRHWEIYRGVTRNGMEWRWQAMTKDSSADNVRPIIPIWPGSQRAVLWLQGKMIAYTNFKFRVVGLIEKQ